MLEITLLRRENTAHDGKASVFQFENDELQAFLADAHATDAGCQVISLRALGVPMAVTGDRPVMAPKPAGGEDGGAKTAGPGTPRQQAPGINTPIQEQARMSQTEIDSNKSYAAAADAKARTQPQQGVPLSHTQPTADAKPVAPARHSKLDPITPERK